MPNTWTLPKGQVPVFRLKCFVSTDMNETKKGKRYIKKFLNDFKAYQPLSIKVL